MNISAETLEQIHPDNQPASRGISILLVSVCILVLGNNLQNTLLGVRAGVEGMSSLGIGLMMSSYFAGFVLGSVYLPRLIVAVGHIRTYAALASMASAITLAYILAVFLPAWVALRFLQGLCYAGMILVIESWLNGCSTKATRGRVLATYGIVFWGTAATSQTLLNLAPAQSFILFGVVSILVSMALVPITLAPTRAPSSVPSKRLQLKRLQAISPLGLLGVLVSGLCIGAAWGMGPVFADNVDLDSVGISLFMASLMAGTLLFQWPLGRLSDMVDRRYVIVVAGTVAGAISLLIAFGMPHSFPVLIALVLLYGGFSFPLYSLGVAHVNDCVSVEESVGTASTLILLQGVGSALGPLIAGALMGAVGPAGLFFFVGTSLLALAVYGLFMIPLRKPSSSKIKRAFMAVPRISHVLLWEYSRRKKKSRGAVQNN
ncbi:MAG: MFS transporter [Chitinivibrionales bacterium]|nr:MFS transporter [Chitinivibrionales bacterium]MBD3357176.1 MFS transporter [Chitinivibrionales bacterium]